MKKLVLSLLACACFVNGAIAQSTNTNYYIVTLPAWSNLISGVFSTNQFNTNLAGGITLTNLNAGLWSVGNFNVRSNLMVSHIVGTPGNPPTILLGVGAGGSASYSLGAGASDVSFTLTVNTGSAPATNGAIFTCTFTTPYTNAVKTEVTANNNMAADWLGGKGAPYITNMLNTSYNFWPGTNALTASQTYIWTFHSVE